MPSPTEELAPKVDPNELPHVPSPYEGQVLKPWQHFILAAYWFASTFHWGALLVTMLPAQIAALDPKHRAETLGLVSGASAIVALIVPLFFAALTDRCASKWGRRRPYMAIGIAINILGLAGMAVSFMAGKPATAESFPASLFSTPSLLLFSLAYMVVQFGNNVTSTAYMGVIPDLVPENQRGAASGWMGLLSQLGTLAGAIVIGNVIKEDQIALQYTAIVAALLGVGSITLVGMKETPLPVKPPKIHWPSYLKSLWISPKEYPDFAWVWITRALVMLGFYAVLPFLNYYLVDVIGVNQDEVGVEVGKLIALILVFASFSGIYGGQLSDKIGRKRVVYVANAGIAVVAIFFIFCQNMTQAMIVGSFFGFFYGAYGSVDYALGTDVLPNKAHAGKDMAVWHIAMTLPQSFASPIAGALIASFGSTTLMHKGEEVVRYTSAGYSAVFILCSVTFGAGAFLLKNVKGVR